MFHVITGSLAGSLGGSLVIGFLGGFVFRGFRPWPWWPDERWEFFAIGAIIGFFFGAVSGIRKMLHQQAVEAIALELGMDFAVKGDSNLVEQVKTMIDSGGIIYLSNVISGRYGDAELVLAEMMHRSHSSGNRGNSNRTVQTIAFFRRDGIDLPRFSMQPEGFLLNIVTNLVGLEDVDFDTHPEFSNAYHLSGDSIDRVRHLFNRDLLDYFSNHQGWKVVGEKNRLLVYRQRRRVASGQLREFIDSAQEMSRLFGDAAETTQGKLIPHGRQQAPPRSGRPSATADGDDDAEDLIAGFLEQPAPREVPPSIAKRFVGGNIVWMLLGGVLCCFSIPALIIGGIAAAEGSLAAILPGIGIAAVGGAIIWGAASVRRSGIDLLSNGRRADAVVESVESTNVSVNGQQRYLATIRYQVFGMPRETKLPLYGGHVRMARRAAESGEPVPMLFHPDSPKKFVLAFQLLPGFPAARLYRRRM